MRAGAAIAPARQFKLLKRLITMPAGHYEIFGHSVVGMNAMKSPYLNRFPNEEYPGEEPLWEASGREQTVALNSTMETRGWPARTMSASLPRW
jgi:hypothetical protein